MSNGQLQLFQETAATTVADPNDLTQVSAALSAVLSKSITGAIVKARNELGTELVSWDLVGMSGQLGGFTVICEVTTSIHAKSGSPGQKVEAQ
jgi:hypothetical protein